MRKVLLLVGTFVLVLGLSGCFFGEDDPDPVVELESLELSGLEDQTMLLNTVFDVFDGVVATGNDGEDYTEFITVASDACYIDDDGLLDTASTGICVLDYTVVVDGKLERVSISITLEREPIIIDPNDPVVKEWTFDTDADLTGWEIYEAAPGSVVASHDVDALKLEVTSGGNSWDARYSYQGLPLQNGVVYTVSFDAKTDVAGKGMKLQFGELISFDPWFVNFDADNTKYVYLTAEWVTYTYSFMMTIDNVNGGPLFEMGDIPDSAGVDATVWLDNISVSGGEGGDDEVAPTIEGAGAVTVFTGDTFDAMLGVTAMDFVDGDMTADVVVTGDTVLMDTVGDYTVTYTVTDEAGNETVVDRVVSVVVDDAAPVITGADDIVVTLGVAFDLLAGITAVDNRDGDVTADIVLGGDVFDIDTAGEYSIDYTVEDETGNSVTVTRLVTVSAMLFDPTDLIMNGTFDASGWGSYERSWDPVITATLEFIDGVGVYTYDGIGDATWNTKIQQYDLPLAMDVTYRIVFDAKGDVAREFSAVVYDADNGVNYASPAFNLTAEWQTFEYTFTYGSDVAPRFELLLGSVGPVEGGVFYFDNVMLEEWDGTAVVADTDVMFNGDLELTNLDNWSHYERSWDPIITGSLVVKGGAAVYTYDGIGDATWNTKVQYFDVDLEFGKTYMLTFDAKGSVEREFTGVFYDGATNWVTPLYTLTTDWQTYEYVFTYNGQALPRLEFLMGNRGPVEGGVFYLDNVAIGALQQEDMLENGTFDNTAGWQTFERSWAPVITATFDVVDGYGVYTYDGIGDATWNTKIQQYNIPLEDGVTYRLVFDAKGDVARDFTITFYDATNYVNYASDPFNLTTDWQTFEFIFTYGSDVMPRFEILLGNIGPAEGGVFYVDNVMTEEWDGAAVVPGTNVMVNSTFEDHVEWGGWYGDQWSGATTSSAMVNDGILEILIEGLDNTMAAYAVQVYQEGFTVEKGVTYTIEFDAYATDARQMNINLGDALAYDPWFTEFMDTATVDLTTEMQHFVITFTMALDTNEEGKLVFELGTIDSVAVNTTVFIDNIIIYPNYNPQGE